VNRNEAAEKEILGEEQFVSLVLSIVFRVVLAL